MPFCQWEISGQTPLKTCFHMLARVLQIYCMCPKYRSSAQRTVPCFRTDNKLYSDGHTVHGACEYVQARHIYRHFREKGVMGGIYTRYAWVTWFWNLESFSQGWHILGLCSQYCLVLRIKISHSKFNAGVTITGDFDAFIRCNEM